MMKISFFADHCVPNSIISKLQNAGFTALKLRDFLPSDSPDTEVIKKTQELKAVLLTLDGDFSNIINYPPQNYGGIISLQIKNHPETIHLITDKLINYLNINPEADQYRQKLLIVESYRIRIIG